ncbi:MAG: PleD family two-component system response regulator [Rhodoblastus sp.]|nr:MAG: PleD family two-component system response regulator [Rhodoblastus sp.]
MTARILVVDDVTVNLKLLEARLTAEYFDVSLAMSGPEALAVCGQGRVDVVLLDVMMPGMDGFETCRRLKADPMTAHIPVVMVTALDQPSDRVKGLEAGADDFLTKPVDEIALLARVRSLARLKMTHDELRGRAITAAGLGTTALFEGLLADKGEHGRVLVVDERASSHQRLAAALGASQRVDVETSPQEAIFRAAESHYDAVLISLGFKEFDALRLCGQLRSLERTRNVPIILVADPEERARLLRGLELGVNDYLTRPVDRNELVARVRAQIKRKRFADAMRETVYASMEAAIVDPLTGVNNRRYLDSHLAAMLAQASAQRKPVSVMLLDIDHFKRVNDTHGHEAGDAVLRGFAARVKSAIRGADLVARMGGEEFLVAMPDTPLDVALKVAERLREAVAATSFAVRDDLTIPVTVSVGVATRQDGADADELLRRADRALYRSKSDGRNRVSAEAA